MASIARYAAEIVMREEIGHAMDRVLTPPLPSPSGLDSTSDGAHESSEGRKSENKLVRRKTSVFSSDKSTWDLKRLPKDATNMSEMHASNSDAKERAPELKVLHVIDFCFINVASYEAYRLPDKLQTYNKKMAARSGIYSSWMKTLVKAYVVKGTDASTIFRSLAQFKGVCELNGVFESMDLSTMSTFINDGAASRSTVRIIARKDNETIQRLPKTGNVQISTYAEAVNF